MIDRFHLDKVIALALEEDMPLGDITTDSLVLPGTRARGVLAAKADGVLAGLDVARRVFEIMDPGVDFHPFFRDGDRIHRGDRIARVEGDARGLLRAERTALNLLQRMSGIASRTAQYVHQVHGLPVRILDTRKTVPGLRLLDKYAVRAGGGGNHRFGLSDGVLIKDNHIVAAGGIGPAVARARDRVPHTIRIEVEVETLEQVREALDSGADILLLDNMDLETMQAAVALVGGRALTEASGNMSLAGVRAVAETGVDLISVGELTHSVKAFDVSLRFQALDSAPG